jgi:hypothetical protein
MEPRKKFFVPVCLYPHTKYRTRDGLEALFEKYSFAENQHVMVVADRLLALDRIVTGRYALPKNVYLKARKEAEQVMKLIRRTAKSHGSAGNAQIYFWDEMADREDYKTFSARMLNEIENSEAFSGHINKFVDTRINRFGSNATPDRSRDAEYEYIVSEVMMSVFCTEQFGYSTEIWERPIPKDAPDPLRILYADFPQLVEKVTGKPVERSLTFLFDEPAHSADLSDSEDKNLS